MQEGKQPRILKRPQTPNYTGMKDVIGRSVVNSVTNNTVINQVDNDTIKKMNDNLGSKMELVSNGIEKMNTSIEKMKYLKAIISNDGFKDYEEEEKLRARYNGF